MLTQVKSTEYTIKVTAEATRLFYIPCQSSTSIDQIRGRAIASAKRSFDYLEDLEGIEFDADVWEDDWDGCEYPVEVTVKASQEFEIEADNEKRATEKAIARFQGYFYISDELSDEWGSDDTAVEIISADEMETTQDESTYTIEVTAEASKLFYIKVDAESTIDQVREQAIALAKEDCEHLYLEDVEFEGDVWEDRFDEKKEEYPIEVTAKVCREFEVNAEDNDKAKEKAIALLEDEFILYDWEEYEVKTEINFVNGEIPW